MAIKNSQTNKKINMITIIDYGIGNVGSIKNMLKKIGQKSIVTSVKEDILASDKLILPGVGAYDHGIEQLYRSNLIDTLNQKVIKDKTPILGICLGMQLFSKGSEEGSKQGLGWINAYTQKFRFNDEINLPVPHMGWNELRKNKDSKLLTGLPINSRFYFVHSYHLNCEDPSDILFTSNYGYEFACGIEKDNILGVQFHPEKSHKFGMQLLKNFAELY